MIITQFTEKNDSSVCKIIFTTKKLKMDLPSLKPPVEKCFKSRAVYKICCSRCQSCYVGQTIRHLITRLKDFSLWWGLILRIVAPKAY